MILWSIRTFWYKGSAENKEKIHVRIKGYMSQKQQPKTKSVFFQKMRYGVNMLILSRYDILMNIKHIISNIMYIKKNNF